jgi:O-antigen ligase
VSVAAGVVVGALATGLLSQASPVWVFLVVAAVLGTLPTFLVRDAEAYWFGVFVVSLMAEVQKAFGDGLNVIARYGFELESAPPVSQLLPELRVSDLPLLVLLGLWAWKLARHRKPFVFPRVAWIAVAYFAWAGLSAMTAPHPYLGAIEWTRQLKFFVIFLWAVNNVDRKALLQVAAVGVVAVLFVQASLTFARFSLGFTFLTGNAFGKQDAFDSTDHLQIAEGEGGAPRRRAFGTVPSPRGTAGHLLLLLPWAALGAARVRDARLRIALLGLFAAGAGALVLTFSRAGLVGFTVGCVLGLAVLFRWGVLTRRALALVVLVGALGGLAAGPVAYRFLTSRPGNVKVREAQYRAAYAMARDHPLLGIGLNNHTLAQRDYSTWATSVPLDDPVKSSFKHPVHSQHLANLVEVGLIGLLLWLCFFAALGRRAWRALRVPDPWLAGVAGASLVGGAALFAQMIADPMHESSVLGLLWLQGALVWVVSEAARRRPPALAADLGA